MNVSPILAAIRKMELGSVRLMEVCGTHTMAIARSGLKKMLPEGISLLSGPGCPVCVTPAEDIDAILTLSENKHLILATYGDMIRVPGSRRGDSLRLRMAGGADVRIVYSPVDAVSLARDNPAREVVFLGVGFETTAPGTAAAVRLAAEQGLTNFTVFPLFRRVEPALRALLADPACSVQGLLCPGHVAVILGEEGFRFLPRDYRMPAVISGFEPEDILLSVYRLLCQIRDGAPALENTYARAVSPEGNALALKMLREVLSPSDELWRGLGFIPDSGYRLAPAYRDFDALTRFGIRLPTVSAPTVCRCGEIIRGAAEPTACPLFGKLCTPEDPVGPCMVSSEGSCAAVYKYQCY